MNRSVAVSTDARIFVSRAERCGGRNSTERCQSSSPGRPFLDDHHVRQLEPEEAVVAFHHDVQRAGQRTRLARREVGEAARPVADGPDVDLEWPARGEGHSHGPVRIVVDDPVRGTLLGDDTTARAAADPGAPVRQGGNPSLDLGRQVVERVDLAVGMGERRAHLAAPVLEGHDKGEPPVSP